VHGPLATLPHCPTIIPRSLVTTPMGLTRLLPPDLSFKNYEFRPYRLYLFVCLLFVVDIVTVSTEYFPNKRGGGHKSRAPVHLSDQILYGDTYYLCILSVELASCNPGRLWGPPNLLYNGYQVSYPWLKRLGRGVDYPPFLVPWLKKEYSCTSTPLLGLLGLF
jgi:hypothetical protein